MQWRRPRYAADALELAAECARCRLGRVDAHDAANISGSARLIVVGRNDAANADDGDIRARKHRRHDARASAATAAVARCTKVSCFAPSACFENMQSTFSSVYAPPSLFALRSSLGIECEEPQTPLPPPLPPPPSSTTTFAPAAGANLVQFARFLAAANLFGHAPAMATTTTTTATSRDANSLHSASAPTTSSTSTSSAIGSD